MLNQLKNLSSYLDKPRVVYYQAAGYTIAAVLGAISFLLFIPFLERFLSADPASAWPWFWSLIAIGAAAFIAQSATTVASYSVSSRDICGVLIDKIGTQVTKLGMGWFDGSKSGQISAAISRDNTVLSHLLSMVLPGVINGLVTPFTLTIGMFFIDWRIAIILALCLSVMMFDFNWVQRKTESVHDAESQAAAELASHVVEFAQL